MKRKKETLEQLKKELKRARASKISSWIDEVTFKIDQHHKEQ